MLKNKLDNSNSDFKSFFLVILIYITSLLEPEFYLVLFSIVFFFLIIANKIELKYIFNFIGILFLLFISGSLFILNNETIYARNDVAFLFKAIICFSIGFILGKKTISLRPFFSYLLPLSIIYTLIWFYFVYENNLNFNNYSEFNYYVFESLPYICTVLLPLIIFRDKFYFLKLHIIIRYICFAIIFLGLFFAFSRNKIFISFLSIFLFLYLKNKKVLTVFTIILFIILFFFSSNLTYFIDYNFILQKFQNSLNEILFFEGNDLGEIYSSWRGFEALRAYQQFQDLSLIKKIFGQSFGATVNLLDNYQMGKMGYYSEIPYVHNGYFHILTKFGYFGIFIVLFFYYKITFPLIKINENFCNDSIILINGIKLIIFFILIFLTLVMTGIFNVSYLDHILLFSGFFNGYIVNCKLQNQCK